MISNHDFKSFDFKSYPTLRLVAPQLNYINVVRLRERHDYADLTLLALYMISQ